MAGSSYGTMFRVTTWGESHGKGIGVVVDGCPAGLPLTEDDIQPFLDRRKPGQSRYTTSRREEDAVEILSGTFEGLTTGTPISMIVYNKNQRSKDYSEIAEYYRPGHADMTYDLKYGFRDYRGGGRSSGRETIGRTAAGAVAVKILDSLGIRLLTYTKSIGPVSVSPDNFDPAVINENPFYMPDAQAARQAAAYVEACMKNKDSAGGVIECVIKNMKSGIGEPAFEKLSANLGKAILSIGAVKGFEIGDGFASAQATGQSNNDQYMRAENGSILKMSNHSGGILGGISDGSDIVFRAAVKPTPSVSVQQNTVTRDGRGISVSIKGRHDPVIVPRAVVVVESMAAITLTDMLLMGVCSRMDNLIRFYKS
ncbi:MAG TPA: chorismate synthase [Candidatus Limivivens intestinipullorum]|uniref:Chorismate synthase n=1 Tax=Candidatus Limivivens intestinipullorum TaxID=2840858 RepID=A0A9D1EV21_9FIRM|nr:chorismate synthase [Candidatus Limivivens intestinipullorum]